MDGIGLDRLVAALDAYVDPHRIPDFAPTGLQVRAPGPEPTVHKVAIGVSANLGFFWEAAQWGADAIVVHHGLFWESDDPDHDPARPYDERRAKFLLESGISLLAYHLPLDAHPVVGNNAEIARQIGLTDLRRDFGDIVGTMIKIGVVGRAVPPIPLDALTGRLRSLFGPAATVIGGGSKPIETMAIVSGGGSGLVYEAIERGVDAFLTGEGREWIPAVVREAGLTFCAVGHHASERCGVQALGRWLDVTFALETRFFHQENPF